MVKKNTEFRFFQWLLGQLGVTEGQSSVNVTTAVNIGVVHGSLCVLLEFDVVEVRTCLLWVGLGWSFLFV